MSFSSSGSVITQTGTDTDQSGTPVLAALPVRFEIGGGAE